MMAEPASAVNGRLPNFVGYGIVAAEVLPIVRKDSAATRTIQSPDRDRPAPVPSTREKGAGRILSDETRFVLSQLREATAAESVALLAGTTGSQLLGVRARVPAKAGRAFIQLPSSACLLASVLESAVPIAPSKSSADSCAACHRCTDLFGAAPIYTMRLDQADDEGAVVAAFGVASDRTRRNLATARRLARHLAAFIRSHKAAEGSERRVSELLLLNEDARRDVANLSQIAQAMASSLQTETVLQNVVQGTAEAFKSTGSGIVLADEERQECVVAAMHSIGTPLPGRRFPLRGSASGWVIRHGQPLFVPWVADTRYWPLCDWYESEGVRSFIGVPLTVHGKTIGSLNVYSRRGRDFKPADVELLLGLAAQAGIAIEHARLYESVAAEKARLEAELDRLKSTILSTVSHELRTPLAAIKGFATSMLRTDMEWDEASRRDFLVQIDREADRLGQLVRNLLDMSRLDTGALRLDREWCDLSELVGDVLARLAPVSREHVVHLDVEQPAPGAMVDRRYLERVVWNLVENACKYSPPGTTVRIGLRRDGDVAALTVRDQGAGMAADERRRVFERFYRGIAARSAPGLGLGLAICRGIVTAHGGSISVDSDPGRGSVFCVRLPAAPFTESFTLQAALL